jgi:Zn-dependent M28 family amino/carboxypeptidase
MNRYFVWLSLIFGMVVSLVGCASLTEEVVVTPTFPVPVSFDGELAYQLVAAQMEFGPRYPGSEGHADVKEWIQASMVDLGWDVVAEEQEFNSIKIQNITATKGGFQAEVPWVVLGAHYDTRQYADQDPDLNLRSESVPGANDGASGVAVLMALARSLPEDLSVNLTLAFFDAEDNGGIDGGEWIQGSRAYAESLTKYPDYVIVVDMIGDSDQQIYLEQSSDIFLAGEIWETAEELGVDTFIFEQKYRIIDDHTPFLELGIPAVDIIDFDYPYWHTSHDTLDKVSAESLQNIGDVLRQWLVQSFGSSQLAK